MGFEYKVLPAPRKGLKARGVKGTEARFAHALETVMNDMGADGWEYQRTDTLPVDERQGLTGKTTRFQNMLVFRRARLTEDNADDAVTALIEDKSSEAASSDVPAAAPHAAPAPAMTTSDNTAAVPEDYVYPWVRKRERSRAAASGEGADAPTPAHSTESTG